MLSVDERTSGTLSGPGISEMSLSLRLANSGRFRGSRLFCRDALRIASGMTFDLKNRPSRPSGRSPGIRKNQFLSSIEIKKSFLIRRNLLISSHIKLYPWSPHLETFAVSHPLGRSLCPKLRSAVFWRHGGSEVGRRVTKSRLTRGILDRGREPAGVKLFKPSFPLGLKGR